MKLSLLATGLALMVGSAVIFVHCASAKTYKKQKNDRNR